MGASSHRLAKLEPWQINAMGLLATVALAGLWYAAGYSPLSEARAARDGVRLDLQEKREALDHLNKVRLAYEQSLERIRDEAKRGSLELRPVGQLLDRISALSKAAAMAGMTLDEIKPGTPIPRERFTVLPIHLAGTGTFPGCASFLHGLRADFPDTGVVGMDLRGEPEQTDKPARFVLDLAWYASRAASTGTSPTQTDPAATK